MTSARHHPFSSSQTCSTESLTTESTSNLFVVLVYHRLCSIFPGNDSPIRRSYQISPLNDVPYATFEHIFLFVLGSTSGSSILTRFLFVTQLAEALELDRCLKTLGGDSHGHRGPVASPPSKAGHGHDGPVAKEML
ncbi:hypothetical protein B0H14DRAFT_3173096 [Mycena olivaceomarginata]|nr:hypothetical protein B0H14DRAFT_3173096 [Mycena olivaceomarginata]